MSKVEKKNIRKIKYQSKWAASLIRSIRLQYESLNFMQWNEKKMNSKRREKKKHFKFTGYNYI